MSYDESSVLEVVEKVSQSVVNINTVRLLHDVFYRVVPIKGMGSGTIIDPKGYVLTNNHVIQGAEKIEVTLASGEVLAGKLVGAYASADIAMVKVDGDGLPAGGSGTAQRSCGSPDRRMIPCRPSDAAVTSDVFSGAFWRRREARHRGSSPA